jgi:hypothetical protein
MALPYETDDVVERGRAVLSTLGSFWLSLHRDKAMFKQYGIGLSWLLAQRLADMLYTLQSLNRHTLPALEPQTWKRISFRESTFTTSQASSVKYGQGIYYGEGSGAVTIYLFGGGSGSPIKGTDIQVELEQVATLTNTPIAASMCLVYGTDFWIENGGLFFRANPFDNPAAPVVEIYDTAGTLVDREITLWGFNAQLNIQAMSDHFGTIIGVTGGNGDEYNTLINAAFDALMDGPSTASFVDMVASVFGVPFTRTDGEVVQDSTIAGDELVIATDKNVYCFNKAATSLVTVGQVLDKGQALTDAVQILTTPRELANLDGLTIDNRLASSLGSHAIAFPNADYPITITTQYAKTKVSTTLLGNPAVIRKFWTDAHVRGVAAGTTLADALDQRTDPETEPGVADLPPTLNPLTLLLQELGHSLLVVKVKMAAVGDRRPNAALGDLLHRVLPSRYITLLIIEHPAFEEYIELSDQFSASLPGGTDSADAGIVAGDGFTESLPILGSLVGTDAGVEDVGPVAWISGNPCP